MSNAEYVDSIAHNFIPENIFWFNQFFIMCNLASGSLELFGHFWHETVVPLRVETYSSVLIFAIIEAMMLTWKQAIAHILSTSLSFAFIMSIKARVRAPGFGKVEKITDPIRIHYRKFQNLAIRSESDPIRIRSELPIRFFFRLKTCVFVILPFIE